jgi:hypothetical protein
VYSVAGLQQTRLFMHRPHTHIAALAASWWKEWCRINLREDFAEIVTVLGCLQLARDAWLGGVLALDSSGYVIFQRETKINEEMRVWIVDNPRAAIFRRLKMPRTCAPAFRW